MTAVATTSLRVYRDDAPDSPVLDSVDGERIAAELATIGVRFERWTADAELPKGAGQEAVIAAYRSSIDRLMAECGYRSVDVVRVERGAPNVETMRNKFLDEHIHAEDEVRFFVEGCGAFYLHVAPHVYRVVCVRGDLIGVPAGTKHWFDMGPDPEFTAVRLFENADGWIAHFTGSTIAQGFPKLDG